MATDERRERMAELAALIAELVVSTRKIDELLRWGSAEMRKTAESATRWALRIGPEDPAYDRLVDLIVKLEAAAERSQRRCQDPTADRLEEHQRWIQAMSEEGAFELKDAMSSHLGREVTFGELVTLITKQ